MHATHDRRLAGSILMGNTHFSPLDAAVHPLLHGSQRPGMTLRVYTRGEVQLLLATVRDGSTHAGTRNMTEISVGERKTDTS